MERAGNDFACLPLCSFLTFLWVKTKYFFSWAAEAHDVQRHHAGIMCVLGLLTYAWGVQPCSRVSPLLTISSPVKSKVGVVWDKRCLFSVGNCWNSSIGRAGQELWKVSVGCGVPPAAPGHLWPQEPQLWLTDHQWPTGPGTGEVSFRRAEIRFHRKVWCKVWCKSMVSHALAALMFRLCPQHCLLFHVTFDFTVKGLYKLCFSDQ